MTRHIRLSESRHEVRGEFFNATNTAHFGNPNVTIGSAQAGRIDEISMPNRIVQIGLRFLF